ncbi:MAG: hypothetical protein KAS32_25130 [Candidatus Peribacteraceae bacterium]|nr:hypothetical protein [Candidatus Peribacteraceae bacterium]
MSSGVRKWDAKGIVDETYRKVYVRMESAATYVEGVAVNLISRDQPVRRSKAGNLYGLDPAEPGTPPKVVTARLRQSVTHLVERKRRKLIGMVGTNVPYGKDLEEGTHPWLRPALLKSRTKLRKIFGVR